MMKCMACGGEDFADQAILWDELALAWELSAKERAYIDRQQGTHCVACRSNLRSSALAEAITTAIGIRDSLKAVVDRGEAASLAVLEINEAGLLNQFLSRLPGHRLAAYPDVDIQTMPFADESFDLVVHSDTLEHVPDPLRALSECSRVLKPTGAMCFTVPTLVGRLTRSCTDRPASYHGWPGQADESYRVWTEFGADAWTWCLRAGFRGVTISTVDYPAALAITAWKGTATPITNPDTTEAARLQARIEAMRSSRSWRLTEGLRRVAAILRS